MPPTSGTNQVMHEQNLGDIGVGRPNLGPLVPVFAYRLLYYSLRAVLVAELGADRTSALYVQAGRLAGMQFCATYMDRSLGLNDFLAQLQKVLKEQAIGILRVERVDLVTMQFVLTVAEDVDCSGLVCSDEIVCMYDEGFIAGIFEAYIGKPFRAKEIDCWASGDRVCRFSVHTIE